MVKTLFFIFICVTLLFAVTRTLSADTVYINPEATMDGTGSIDSPLNHLPEISSSTAFLIKGNTTLPLNHNIDIGYKHDITFSSWGRGEKPVISAGEGVKKLFNIYDSEHIIIENLELKGSGSQVCGIGCGTTSEGKDILIRNVRIHDFIWGIRAIANVSGIKIKDSEIYNTLDDGIFMKKADSILIQNCKIYRVNQNWLLKGHSQKVAAGDCIQLESCSNWVVEGNILDRRDTGNKFAFIANNGEQTGGKVLNNTIFTPFNSGDGGAGIYMSGGLNGVLISGNEIHGFAGEKAVAGIYLKSGGYKIVHNTFINVEGMYVGNAGGIVDQNIYCGIPVKISGNFKGTNQLGKDCN